MNKWIFLQSSQAELYTVSVESMPQYNNGGCCKAGRVGNSIKQNLNKMEN